MKKFKFILATGLLAFCYAASAQEHKTNQEATINSNRRFTAQHIPVNPSDTATMRRILMILNPAFFTPDPTAKIYTNEERDSILKMVEGYRNEINKR